MCKYCKMNPGVPGEWTNEAQTIGCVKDGSTVFTAMLNRYVDEGSDYRANELVLDQSVRMSDGLHTVQQKIIHIKYCPFCGEKL